MSSVILPSAPEGYSYYIQKNWNSQFHAIWLINHTQFSYTTEEVKTIWGFLKKTNNVIYSPINSKKPGKPATFVTQYSAMTPPNKKASVPVSKLPQPSTNALINALY